MYAKWGIIPKLPSYGWPRLSAQEAYPDDSAPDDGDDSDDTATIDSGAILDDADFYAGSGYTPDGGNQPAGPLPLRRSSRASMRMITSSLQLGLSLSQAGRRLDPRRAVMGAGIRRMARNVVVELGT